MDIREDLPYWQVIELPDGTVTPGKADHRAHPAYLNIDDPDLLKGKRVLDVAANDGFWSFWAEQQGAAEVLATDVERLEEYDWGYAGPPPGTQLDKSSDSVFHYLHDLLDSKVKRRALSVYDHDPDDIGEFDLVLCYGLIYHLRHPLRALDALRRVCRGACIIETHALLCSEDAPLMAFYEDNVCEGSQTNWCGPTTACMAHWMKSAGFSQVYIMKHISGDRQLFVGAVHEAWRERFDACPKLKLCDETYFKAARGVLKSATVPGEKLTVSLFKERLGEGQAPRETPAQIVRRLYRNIFGREADERALANFVPQLEKGMPEARLRMVLALSPEARERLLTVARRSNDEKRFARFCVDALTELGLNREHLEEQAAEPLGLASGAALVTHASSHAPAPDKLDFGCGNAPREGYAGVDIRPGSNVAYCCNAWEIGAQVAPDSIQEVFSHHFFEHLTFRQGEATLAAWYRILAPGGRLQLVLPDLRYHVEQFLNPEAPAEANTEWTNSEHALAGFFGWQRESMHSDWDVHKSGYDFPLLRSALQRKGFVDIARQNDAPWQLNVTAAKPNGAAGA